MVLEQTAVASGTTATPTISAASAGDLLIFTIAERSGGTSFTGPSGYTKIGEQYVQPSDGTYRRSMAVYIKEAAGGETSASGSSNSGGTCKGVLQRYSLDSGAGEDDLTHLDTIEADNGATQGASSLASGNTADIEYARALAHCALFLKQSNADAAYSDSAFTNDPGLETVVESMEQNGRSISIGWGNATTEGVRSTTASWDNHIGTNQAEDINGQNLILSYVRTKAAGGGTTILPQMMQHHGG